MDLTTFEGTWESVLLHGKELAGHHVRVTVLDIDNTEEADALLQGDSLEQSDVLLERVMAIGQRCAALPVLDDRSEDELLGSTSMDVGWTTASISN